MVNDEEAKLAARREEEERKHQNYKKKVDARDARSRSRSNSAKRAAQAEMRRSQQFIDHVHQMGQDLDDAQAAVGMAAKRRLDEIEEEERRNA